MPGFTTLAGQCNNRRMLQSDITHTQITKLLYPRPGIIQNAEQCHIPASGLGGSVGSSQQVFCLFRCKVPDDRLLAFFARNLQNPLAQMELPRFLHLNVTKKRMDGDKPLVSGGDGAVPLVLRPFQKPVTNSSLNILKHSFSGVTVRTSLQNTR